MSRCREAKQLSRAHAALRVESNWDKKNKIFCRTTQCTRTFTEQRESNIKRPYIIFVKM